MVALDAGYTLYLRGQDAAGSGWMNRAVRLLRDEPPCAEQGYLVFIEFETALAALDLEIAAELALRLQAHGAEFGDQALVALGLAGQGQVFVKQGRVTEGMALLDEAMLTAVSGDIDPSWAGNIYCNIMMTCNEIGDLGRASEWTQATARWCEEMPGAGPFMGICRVHRAEVLQVLGDWDEAERDLLRVCDELADFIIGMVAEAHYRLGDLRRQRGDLEGADTAFRTAHQMGRDPQPGLALRRTWRRAACEIGRCTSGMGSRSWARSRAATRHRCGRCCARRASG
jgi:tetratricopeptide (TPR) repeat protein